MAGQLTTPLQVSGYRFELRRIERALLSGDTGRRQPAPGAGLRALAMGGLLTVLVVAGCALLAFVRPQPAPDSAPIVLGQRSGALYVWVGDVLHPVLNLTSARLIAATAADPQPVPEAGLRRVKRGPSLGIPGAPQLIGEPLTEAGATWSVCDTAGQAGLRTTVVVGAGQAGAGQTGVGAQGPQPALVVTSGPGATAYLLYRGRRSFAGPAETVPGPRRVSRLLLSAIPEAPPPPTPPAMLGRLAATPADAPTVCVNWARSPDGRAEITVSTGAGLPLPAGSDAVPLAGADGDGPGLDAVYLPPGRSAYVRAVGVAGQAGGARYLVTDSGVRFPLGDDDTARSLGLPETPVAAPGPVLTALPAGPQLDRRAALVARDVLGVVAQPVSAAAG